MHLRYCEVEAIEVTSEGHVSPLQFVCVESSVSFAEIAYSLAIHPARADFSWTLVLYETEYARASQHYNVLVAQESQVFLVHLLTCVRS